jgi:isoquinoline 1-oxidoreductase
MSDPSHDITLNLESERYELFEKLRYRFDWDRRDFLKLLGGGILISYLADLSSAQQAPERRRGGRGAGQGVPGELGAWLHIGTDGQITVFTGKAEVGQNIRTSLMQVVAEELHVTPDSIRLVMGDTQLTPFDMGTFGSRTTPDMSRRLRRAAAAARELLIDFAADEWKTKRALLKAEDGRIVNTASKDIISFSDLTRRHKLTKTISDETPISAPETWTVAGRSAPKVNGRSFVTGAHRYASDVRLPGMWHGKVLRPPSYGATLVSVDFTKARAMPDVVVVRDGDFVGVAAPNESLADAAFSAIKAQWKPGPPISGKTLYSELKEPPGDARPQGGRGSSAHEAGSITQGMEAADIRLAATYAIAYIAHAPLEPRAAVVQWQDGKLTAWTGSQRPFGVRSDLARAFGLADDAVRVIVPDTGAGYGGKHTGEAAIEAARLAREARRPVKLVWSREEEFTWAYFRPAGVIEVNSGVSRDGKLIAWEFHNYNSGPSGIRTLYEVANQRIAFHPSRSPLRQGSYRALAATANHFARESHMDELAHAAHLDPLGFRLRNLKDPRLRAVLEAAAAAFPWIREKSRPDHGIGIAAGSEKGSYVATCAEVLVDRPSGAVRVTRAASAFECGTIVNPDHLKNQVEGAMIMGLGGALFEAIEFEDGRILNPRFSRYRVPRFRDAPQIEVVLVDRRDLPPAGAGETPIVAIAPAIGNAIFNAAGVRLRSLPLAPHGLKGVISS